MDSAVTDQTVTSAAFRTYLAGFGASLLADSVWFVSLGWAASRLGDPLTASLVMSVGTVPRAVLLLLGGAIADRAGPLRMVLVSQQARLVMMVLASIALFWWSGSPYALAAFAGVFGLLDALHMPATASLPPRLLHETKLPDGQGLVQTTERLMGVCGAPLAGVAVGLGGIKAATAVAAILLAVGLLLLRRLKASLTNSGTTVEASRASSVPPAGRQVLSETMAGLRYVKDHRVIAPILLVVTAVNLALSAPLNLGLAFAAADYGWSGTQYGLTLGAFSAGAALGALSVLRWRPALPAKAGLLWVAVGSIALGLLSFCEAPSAAALTCAVLGFSSGPAGALLLGLVQGVTPPQVMGRVMSLTVFSALGVAPLANILFGTLTQLIDLKASFALFATAELLTVAIALSRRQVRRAQALPHRAEA